MDCRTIAENMWSDIYAEHYNDSDNLCSDIIRRAEASPGKTGEKKAKKGISIPLSVGLAAALTVTAGAAANWDIASLFMSVNAGEREYYSNEYFSGLSEAALREYYPEGEYTVHGVSAETEYDMLQKLSREIDRDFYVAGHDVHITGYAYDGYWLELLYEVKFDEDVPDVSDGIYAFPVGIRAASYDSGYSSRSLDLWETKITQITEDTVKYRSYHNVMQPDDLSIRLFVYDNADLSEPHKEWQRIGEQGMAYDTENYIDIELNGINEYSYTTETDLTMNNEYTVGDPGHNNNIRKLPGVISIRRVSIAPFGVVISGTSDARLNGGYEKPLIAVFRDGSVLDLMSHGGETYPDGSGGWEFTQSFSFRGVLLDAREIAEIRIGDFTVPISM